MTYLGTPRVQTRAMQSAIPAIYNLEKQATLVVDRRVLIQRYEDCTLLDANISYTVHELIVEILQNLCRV